MEKMQQLKDLYTGYEQNVVKLYKEAKPMDGLFGWGDDPRKDPCHMRFYEDLERWMGDFSAAAPGQEEAFAVVRFVLSAAAEHRETPCYWFMFAAQGLTRDLIPVLSAQQCRQLREFYDEAYPRRDRMPVQKEVYSLLKKGSGRKIL